MDNKYYILEGKEPKPADMMDWAKGFGDDESKRVDQTYLLGKSIWVSTVFLGINHQWGDGPPMLFETMIFGGIHDQEQWRYSTWDEAQEGHDRAVVLASRSLLRSFLKMLTEKHTYRMILLRIKRAFLI